MSHSHTSRDSMQQNAPFCFGFPSTGRVDLLEVPIQKASSLNYLRQVQYFTLDPTPTLGCGNLVKGLSQ